MNRMAFEWARKQTGLTRSAKLALFYLAGMAGQDCRAPWNAAEMARLVEVMDNSIYRAMRELVSAGLVEKINDATGRWVHLLVDATEEPRIAETVAA